MANTFFLSWKLWLQLTFCLGSAIFLVFLGGLVKLFFKNRLVRKHTVLDEEKRARQQEMRSSGLPIPRKMDIPFGVRAIQSGVEVDGIWISRSNTPVDSEAHSRAPSVILGPDVEPKGKERATLPIDNTRQPLKPSAEPLSPSLPSPRETGPSLAVRIPSTGSPATYKPKQSKRSASSRVEHLEASPVAVSRPEGKRSQPPRLDTYLPTNSASRPQHIGSLYSDVPDRRGSSSSEENFRTRPTHPSAQAVQLAHTPTRKRSPFEDPDPSSPTMDFLEDSGYFPPATNPQMNPFEASESQRGSGSERHNVSSRQHRYNDSVEPGRGRRPSQSGSVHANTQTRRVNAGFEVLPAGTFNRTNSEMDLESQTPRASNRLQRKARE